jgi:hypothetical protein
MNMRGWYLRSILSVMTVVTVASSQTASPGQKKSGQATNSVGSKPLSFFVGSWVRTYNIPGGYNEPAPPGATQDGSTTITYGSDRMLIESSGGKGELQVSLARQYNWMDNRYNAPQPDVIHQTSETKGKIVKIGPDYKYIQSLDGGTCQQTVTIRTRRGDDRDETPPCIPDQRTYTVKIVSQDEIRLVYKPDGSEQEFHRE